MWGAGAMGGAIYMKASVTCDWAEAVVRKPLEKWQKQGRIHDSISRVRLGRGSNEGVRGSGGVPYTRQHQFHVIGQER